MAKTILTISFIAFFLSILKIIIGYIDGSLIVLASALDSFVDVLISLFNYFALKKSLSPSNEYFNYGFGKLEGLSCVFESLFIFVFGIFVGYKSIIKFISDEGINNVNHSIFIMLISIFTTLFIIFYLSRFKSSNSVIIDSEILHYKTDLFGNLIALISLGIISISSFYKLDSILGGIFGIYICFSAFKIFKKGLFMLLDRALDSNLVNKITNILDSNNFINGYHNLKSRISGNNIFLECHLVFDNNISLFRAHSICNDIEKSIANLSSDYKWVILMHLDPYDDREHEFS